VVEKASQKNLRGEGDWQKREILAEAVPLPHGRDTAILHSWG